MRSITPLPPCCGYFGANGVVSRGFHFFTCFYNFMAYRELFDYVRERTHTTPITPF